MDETKMMVMMILRAYDVHQHMDNANFRDLAEELEGIVISKRFEKYEEAVDEGFTKGYGVAYKEFAR